jgi:CDGSH-type Zn-finger protein
MDDTGAAGRPRQGAAGERVGAVVTPYPDGPLILRGQFVIMSQDGRAFPTARQTVALCRCGRSAIKPFCDGSHARTGFRARDRVPGQATAAPGRAAAQNGHRGGGPQ